MNSINEKEKKLNSAIDKLKNLDLNNSDIQNNVKTLNNQKNQLEIEKSQLEEKYNSLLTEHTNLSKKLEEIQNKEKSEEKNNMKGKTCRFLIVILSIVHSSSYHRLINLRERNTI